MLKKKDKHYSKKRKNIAKTTFSFDENNNLYLTLPKFDYGKRIREVINEKREAEEKEKEKSLSSVVNKESNTEEKKNHLEDLIPEFFENNKTRSEESIEAEFNILTEDSNSESELNEMEQKMLFDKLRTKKNFNKKDEDKKTNNPTQSFRYGNRVCHNSGEITSLRSNNLASNRVTALSFIKSFSPPNGKFITSVDVVNKSFKRDHSLPNINTDPLIANIKKLRQKTKIINKEKKKDKKVKIHPVDLFYYDKNKWQKQKMRESDKILKQIQEFEDRRNGLFNKMMSSNKLPTVGTSRSKLIFNRKNTDNLALNKIGTGIYN